MQCRDFDRRMQQLLDHRKLPELDFELRQHAALCTSCHRQLDVQERLFQGLEYPLAAAPGADFARRVVATAAPVRRRQADWRAVRTACAAAAAVLLLVVVPIASRWLSGSSDTEVVVTPRPAPRVVSPLNPGVAHLDRGPQSSQATELALDTGRTLITDWLLRDDHQDQVGHLADGLRPIASSFSVAIDALRSTVPIGRGRARDKGASLRPARRFVPFA